MGSSNIVERVLEASRNFLLAKCKVIAWMAQRAAPIPGHWAFHQSLPDSSSRKTRRSAAGRSNKGSTMTSWKGSGNNTQRRTSTRVNKILKWRRNLMFSAWGQCWIWSGRRPSSATGPGSCKTVSAGSKTTTPSSPLLSLPVQIHHQIPPFFQGIS